MSVDLDNPRPGCEDYHAILIVALAERDALRAQFARYKQVVLDKLHYDLMALLPGTPENRLTAERDALRRQVHRLIHDEEIESDRICDHELEATNLRGELNDAQAEAAHWKGEYAKLQASRNIKAETP